MPAVGLQIWLDLQGRVLRLSGPLRPALALHSGNGATLLDYVQPLSSLALEGEPADWQGQTLDLDFQGPNGQTLHTRGWLMPQEDCWLLQMFDIGDLLQERQQARSHLQNLRLARDLNERLRLCEAQRLNEIVGEQMHELVRHWRLSRAVLLLPAEQGWQTFAESVAANGIWPSDRRLSEGLQAIDASRPLRANQHPALQPVFGAAAVLLLPFHDRRGVAAWLVCAAMPGQVLDPSIEKDGPQLLSAMVEPLIARLSEQRYEHRLQGLEALQGMLGTGWWEMLEEHMLLAPALVASLGLGPTAQRLALKDWLALTHPADREELGSALRELEQKGTALLLCVRLQTGSDQAPIWYRISGQALGSGSSRRLVGFMLDISDIKNQQQQAAAAHARLDNLIASSPAVIYVQRYEQGALRPDFFSASLQPLLGWTREQAQGAELAQWIHPEDHATWFQRTRTLLREGQASTRYRLRDSHGNYHWLLDEVRLLRDDLGVPVEAVGLWLDVTDATLAAERVRESEERYRILVEDSPAMICRYRPDLVLTFGNRPLADYLECTPDDLPGVDLGSWLSAEQREAFVLRLSGLSPDVPVSTAEICLQLPGREHAWWIWSDRGVFDAAGQLIEVQAVGRDNTQVRRTQQQLMQSAKMATLGEMATGLAHEINQPLNVMRMAIVNVLKRLDTGDVQIDYLQDKLKRIDSQVQRAARVVDHMRVFGRRSEIEQQPFDPRQAVEGTLSLLAEGMRGKGVELRVEALEMNVQVRGFVDQLEQVLINLMVNARDALLSRREKLRDFQPWIAVRAEAEEHWVRLFVEDNGGGIDPRLLERIFEPFFTTKPVGVGTGLGLSVSFGIIDNMGGRMSVSNTAEGARFCVELPVAQIIS
ncbi:PAS domain S-box protein [Pseudomonas sp. R5(2019)]|nr:PAS domain S-box protein [Pseudomonas sp. R5(2019)]